MIHPECVNLVLNYVIWHSITHSYLWQVAFAWVPWMCAFVSNAAQHTTTHCNTLQHTATHCSTLQHPGTPCDIMQRTAASFHILQHTTTHFNKCNECALSFSTTVCCGVWWCVAVCCSALQCVHSIVWKENAHSSHSKSAQPLHSFQSVVVWL